MPMHVITQFNVVAQERVLPVGCKDLRTEKQGFKIHRPGFWTSVRLFLGMAFKIFDKNGDPIIANERSVKHWWQDRRNTAWRTELGYGGEFSKDRLRILLNHTVLVPQNIIQTTTSAIQRAAQTVMPIPTTPAAHVKAAAPNVSKQKPHPHTSITKTTITSQPIPVSIPLSTITTTPMRPELQSARDWPFEKINRICNEANALVKEGEFDQAIAKYDEIVQAKPYLAAPNEGVEQIKRIKELKAWCEKTKIDDVKRVDVMKQLAELSDLWAKQIKQAKEFSNASDDTLKRIPKLLKDITSSATYPFYFEQNWLGKIEMTDPDLESICSRHSGGILFSYRESLREKLFWKHLAEKLPTAQDLMQKTLTAQIDAKPVTNFSLRTHKYLVQPYTEAFDHETLREDTHALLQAWNKGNADLVKLKHNLTALGFKDLNFDHPKLGALQQALANTSITQDAFDKYLAAHKYKLIKQFSNELKKVTSLNIAIDKGTKRIDELMKKEEAALQANLAELKLQEALKNIRALLGYNAAKERNIGENDRQDSEILNKFLQDQTAYKKKMEDLSKKIKQIEPFLQHNNVDIAAEKTKLQAQLDTLNKAVAGVQKNKSVETPKFTAITQVQDALQQFLNDSTKRPVYLRPETQEFFPMQKPDYDFDQAVSALGVYPAIKELQTKYDYASVAKACESLPKAAAEIAQGIAQAKENAVLSTLRTTDRLRLIYPQGHAYRLMHDELGQTTAKLDPDQLKAVMSKYVPAAELTIPAYPELEGANLINMQLKFLWETFTKSIVIKIRKEQLEAGIALQQRFVNLEVPQYDAAGFEQAADNLEKAIKDLNSEKEQFTPKIDRFPKEYQQSLRGIVESMKIPKEVVTWLQKAKVLLKDNKAYLDTNFKPEEKKQKLREFAASQKEVGPDETKIRQLAWLDALSKENGIKDLNSGLYANFVPPAPPAESSEIYQQIWRNQMLEQLIKVAEENLAIAQKRDAITLALTADDGRPRRFPAAYAGKAIGDFNVNDVQKDIKKRADWISGFNIWKSFLGVEFNSPKYNIDPQTMLVELEKLITAFNTEADEFQKTSLTTSHASIEALKAIKAILDPVRNGDLLQLGDKGYQLHQGAYKLFEKRLNEWDTLSPVDKVSSLGMRKKLYAEVAFNGLISMQMIQYIMLYVNYDNPADRKTDEELMRNCNKTDLYFLWHSIAIHRVQITKAQLDQLLIQHGIKKKVEVPVQQQQQLQQQMVRYM